MTGLNLGLDHSLRELARRPDGVFLIGREWPLPAEGARRLRVVRLHPEPGFPWSLFWRRTTPIPGCTSLRALLRCGLRTFAGPPRWLPEPRAHRVERIRTEGGGTEQRAP